MANNASENLLYFFRNYNSVFNVDNYLLNLNCRY